MLAFVKNVENHLSLVKLAELLGQHHGILTLAHLVHAGEYEVEENKRNIESKIRQEIARHGFQAFIEVHSVTDFQEGFVEIAKGHGLGGLRTNTVLFDWSDDSEGQIKELRAIDALRKIDKNILLLHSRFGITERGRRIDIWWRGQQNNGDLMLMCAYLLILNPQWEEAKIRILSVVDNEDQKAKLSNGIRQLLPKARIDATVHVIVGQGNFKKILHDNSRESDMVFLGLPSILEGNELELAEQLSALSAGLKTTVFVQNNSMSHSLPILLKVDG